MEKTLIIVLVSVLIIGGIGVGIYLIKVDKMSGPRTEQGGPSASGPQAPQGEENLAKEDFSVYIPEGWRKTAPPQGVSAMVINADEEITDPAAKKINFRTYFAVSYDSLQGKSMEEYIQILKNNLAQTVGNIDFGGENAITVNGREARAIDAGISQQGAEFKVLIVAIRGGGEDIWLLSFNTVKSSWDKYRDLFAEITNSFQVK